MKWLDFEWQGRTVRVPVLKAQGRLWFHWQGETRVLELESGARKRGAGAGKAQPGIIHAPMPGKITKVNVQVGSQVQVGQALVVMEAMKMEYTLEADVAGRVSELNATVGAQVPLGAVLVRVEV